MSALAARRPVTINQPTTRRFLWGWAHCSARLNLSHPVTPTRAKNMRATEMVGRPANMPAFSIEAR